MKIASGVYLVASGHMGFDLTDAYDCNVYLFDAGDAYILFDAGAGLGVAQLLEVCKCDGIDLSKIKHLFLTHAHADHSGGAKELSEQLEANIYASEQTAARVEQGDEVSLSLDVAKGSGVYPKDYRYKPFKVNSLFKHGDTFTFNDLTLEVIAAPGHSDDHHSFSVTLGERRYLLAGDAIFHGGKIVLQNTYDCNVPKMLATIHLLNSYNFDALLPGHGAFSLKEGKRHVTTACSYIEVAACPPSL